MILWVLWPLEKNLEMDHSILGCCEAIEQLVFQAAISHLIASPIHSHGGGCPSQEKPFLHQAASAELIHCIFFFSDAYEFLVEAVKVLTVQK